MLLWIDTHIQYPGPAWREANNERILTGLFVIRNCSSCKTSKLQQLDAVAMEEELAASNGMVDHTQFGHIEICFSIFRSIQVILEKLYSTFTVKFKSFARSSKILNKQQPDEDDDNHADDYWISPVWMWRVSRSRFSIEKHIFHWLSVTLIHISGLHCMYRHGNWCMPIFLALNSKQVKIWVCQGIVLDCTIQVAEKYETASEKSLYGVHQTQQRQS